MKTKGIAVAVLAVVFALVLSAWENARSSSQAARLIAVTGEAEVRVVPDEVILTLGIETWDKDLGRAKEQNDAIVQRVMALAARYAMPPEHVQTDYIGVEPRYRDGYYEQRDFIGYFVRKSVVLRLRDLSKFEGLLTDVLEAGVNYVQGIEFRTTELRKYRDEARAMALQAAREKAAAMTKQLGQKVGQPLTIEEQQSNWWSGYSAWWGGGAAAAMTQNAIQEFDGATLSLDGSLAPGQISIRASVSVEFEMTN